MTTHVDFLKAVITQPLHVIRKDYETARHGRKSSTLTPDIPNTVIDGIFDEEFVIDPARGKKKTLHRIFAKSFETHDYKDVGWILNDDIDMCMLCRKAAFGMFSYKHHCKACGNVMCSECTPCTAPIHELRSSTEFRVCNLCYYGQEVVYATLNRPRPKVTAPPALVAPVAAKPVAQTNEEIAEERMRKLKIQQQEEFKRNAMERLRGQNSISRERSLNNEALDLSGKSNGSGRGGGGSNKNTVTAADLIDTESDVEERRRRLLSFGPMQSHTPVAGFVVKTKRSSGTKIFINICACPAVPLRPEPSASRIDAAKKLNLLINTPVEHQNEKDGSYCVLFDVVTHPDELHVCNIDASGQARARLIAQALQLVMAAYKEEVAMAPKILQVASNYKGRDESGSVNVRALLVPCADAFYISAQIAAVPAPLLSPSSSSLAAAAQLPRDSQLLPSARPSIAGGSNSNSNRVDIDVPRPSELSRAQHRQSVVALRGSIILDSVGDSAGLGVDRALKAMILPRDETSRLFGKNFNFVLDAMKSQEVNLKDVLIYPSPGFVLTVNRVKPLKRLFINVAHHPAVGFVAQQRDAATNEDASPSSSSNAKGRRKASVYVLPSSSSASSSSSARGRTSSSVGLVEIPRPLPHILGQVLDDVDDPLYDPSSVTSGSGRSTIIDFVVPSAVFFACLNDETGDLREQLAKEVLLRLADLGIRLHSDFQLLSQPLYMQTNPLYREREIVPPVLNLTEEEKARFSAAFIGKMQKQGHSVKTWKERLVFIAENKLQYFDLKMNFKGEFNVEDCNFVAVDPNDREKLKEMGVSPGAFAFQLVNYAGGGQFLNCAVASEHMRDLYELVLQTRNAHIASLKTLVQIPDMKTGWLQKQGHMVKNWKRRFFVLNYGVLAYYEQDSVANHRGVAEAPKGKVNLKGATITVVTPDEVSERGKKAAEVSDLRLCVADVSGVKLYLQGKSRDEKKEWFDALRRHVLYANEYND